MKTKILALSALLIILGASGAYAINNYQFGNKTPEATTDLTDQEIQGLQYMHEEEKLARDVYTKLNEKWPDLAIFSNIAQSEQKHMDSIKKLLDKYGIDDPAEGNDIGVFTNQELQSLFNQLVTEGEQSLINALTVGGKIEELDITDLNNYIGLTDKYDITRVYSNLVEGSKNHLRAFVKELTTQGFTYVPFYLSQQEFDDIINLNQIKISQNDGLQLGNRLGNILKNVQAGQQNPNGTSCLDRLCNRTRVCTP
jgi:hypothetical protein